MGVPGSFTVKFSYGEPVSLSHFEVFVGTSPGFTITGWDGKSWIGEPNDPADWDGVTNTLRVVSRSRPIDVLDLTPGERYYVRVVAVNRSKMRSIPSNEASGVAKKVGSEDYEDGSIRTIHIVQHAITGMEVLQVSDDLTTISTSTEFVPIPGFNQQFYLDETNTVFLFASLAIAANTRYSTTSPVATRMVLDGVPIHGTERLAHLHHPADDWRIISTSIAMHAFAELEAGSHFVRVDFMKPNSTTVADVRAGHRVLSVQKYRR